MYHSLRIAEDVQTLLERGTTLRHTCVILIFNITFPSTLPFQSGLYPYGTLSTSAHISMFNLILTITFDEDSELRNSLCVVSFSSCYFVLHTSTYIHRALISTNPI